MNNLIGNSRILQLFAICDLYTFIRFFDLLKNSFDNLLTGFWYFNILSIFLLISLLATAYFNFSNPLVGIRIYYFQLIPRFTVLILTFGFITKLTEPTALNIYQPLLYLAMGLELLRLMFNILTHKQLTRKSAENKN